MTEHEHNEVQVTYTTLETPAALLDAKAASQQAVEPKAARKQGVGEDFRYLYWE